MDVFKSATDQTIFIELVDSATGLPKTGIVYTDVTGSYSRTRSARVAITMATLASASTAHADGGFILVDDTNQPGVYRVDVPDAAFATGASEVVCTFKATGCRTVSRSINLVNINNQIAYVPNAAADAAGGLPISDAGGLDLDSKLANTNEVTTARMGALTDWIDGGRLDLILDVIAADTTTDIPALINAGVNVTAWNSVSLATTNPLPNAAASGVGGLITAPTTANVAYADVKRLHGTTWLVPAVAGTPDVNAKLVNNDATAAATLHKFAYVLDQTTGQIDAGTFAAGAIDAAALASDAVAEIQSGLSTAAELLLVKDRVSYCLTVLIGACSDAGTSAETYVHAIGGETFTVDYTGLDATGNRTTTTLSKV